MASHMKGSPWITFKKRQGGEENIKEIDNKGQRNKGGPETLSLLIHFGVISSQIKRTRK